MEKTVLKCENLNKKFGKKQILKNVSLEMQEGDIKVISFKQKMLLQSYEYLLCLGCTGFQNGELVVYHRLYDACNISVLAHRDTVGIFDMDSIIEIN